MNLAASHWSLGHAEKAIRELKKAISINPLNENGLVFYSDALFSLNKYDQAIEPLEFFVKYNDRSEFVWERLARSYYYTNQYNKAKFALENLASFSKDSSVLNNLGLVYWKLGEHKKAASHLVEAYNDAIGDRSKSSYAALNLSCLLNDLNNHKGCRAVLDRFRLKNTTGVKEKILYKIYIQYLVALESLGLFEEASSFIDDALRQNIEDIESKLLLLVFKVHCQTVINNNKDMAYETIDEMLRIYNTISGPALSEESKSFVFNNINFCYLYFGDVKQSGFFISKIKKYVHLDPYCTATYGLYLIKNGHLDQGRNLYEEAISLCKRHDFKEKIRQRMYLELGKFFLDRNDLSQAKTFLNRAVKQKFGYKYAADEANKFITSLPN